MKTETRGVGYMDKSEWAFTRLECVLCVVGVMLLVSVAAPSLANTRSRSQRATCVDNLRLIGQGMQLWGVEHDNQMSWQVFAPEGGTRPPIGSRLAAAFYEFAWISNQLMTPKILVCPSDMTRVRNAADNWSTSASGGYINVQYRDNATSYAINMHCFIGEPKSPVCTDRNLRVDAPSGSTCSLGFNNISQILSSPISNVAWTNAIHGLTGNILTAEGSVLQIPDSALKPYWNSALSDDNGAFHILIP